MNLDNYTRAWKNDENDEQAAVRYCSLELEGRTVIGTHSKRRAEKDRHERAEKLLKAQKLLQKPDNIERKARQYFLQKDGHAACSLDEQKIKQSEQFSSLKALHRSKSTVVVLSILDCFNRARGWKAYAHFTLVSGPIS